MTTNQIRIAVAECLGWSVDEELEDGALMGHYNTTDSEFEAWDMVPDYPASLDACAEFEKTLTTEQEQEYLGILLNKICTIPSSFPGARNWKLYYRVTTAIALQRCEAYLRVKGKWTE